MLTVFSWGYEGWGNSTRQLLQAFDTAEQARGFEPPVFVDVRVRRQVRALGFQDDAFELRTGRARYRWLPGLGNAAIGTGKGVMRLVTPADVHELLGIAQAQRRQRRRVIFFCSCGSPFLAGTCHRQLVRRTLLSAARSLGVKASVQEWPGGPLPERVLAELSMDEARLASLLGGARAVRLGQKRPHVQFLAWPTGGLLRLRSRERTQLVSVAAARFHAGEWKMPLFVHPVEQDDTGELLLRHARQFRRQSMLEEFRTG